MGKPVVTILDGDNLNLSPLRGYKEVVFVSIAQKLVRALNNIVYQQNIEGQGKDYFYLGNNLRK